MLTIRKATLHDLDALMAIELSVFSPASYHLTNKRQYHYLLTKAKAEIWVTECDKVICAAAVLFFKKNTSLIRLYSIAVLPEFQGNAVGKALFEHAEDQVRLNAKKGLTLEVRLDNQRHTQRYLKLGYQPYSEVDEYYPDGMACLKLKKLFS